MFSTIEGTNRIVNQQIKFVIKPDAAGLGKEDDVLAENSFNPLDGAESAKRTARTMGRTPGTNVMSQEGILGDLRSRALAPKTRAFSPTKSRTMKAF